MPLIVYHQGVDGPPSRTTTMGVAGGLSGVGVFGIVPDFFGRE